MDTINSFGWPEVAAIAGALLVLLMSVVGCLLAVILRRQGGDCDDVIMQVKEIQNSIEGKIDAEVDDRKKDFETLRKTVEVGRAERRQDINTLHKKLELGLDKVVGDFRIMCDHNQEQCGAVQRAEMKGTREKLLVTCRTIEKIDKDRQVKWRQQELLNRSFLNKTKAMC